LRLVIDTNVYLFAFGLLKVPVCEELIAVILEQSPHHIIRISANIVEEVRPNLTGEAFREFFSFLNALSITIDGDYLIPFELGAKYESKGLKPADALIAAYTEWVGANALVTENRHFLTLQVDLPFSILTAQKCLNLIRATHK
jgi:predicted nucleic acid-binding protein